MKNRSEQGVALVITLILLSVITFMAVTFLVVSRHEGAQVDTIAQQTGAKNSADAAVEAAKARIMANILTTGNGYNFGLVVSTNLISGVGYQSGNTSVTNVSYNDGNGNFLSAAALPGMLNNLLILPRAPVFVTTNSNKNLATEFRYYLDLNRNGAYDTNGAVAEQDASGNQVTNVYVGDPEWIGILNHPDQRHSSSNLFVGRYCFIAVPIGNSLDANYIHNQSKVNSLAVSGNSTEGFLRNQGVGSWEINLAGFLNSLNSNVWLYKSNDYSSIGNLFFPSQESAFLDAGDFMQYRKYGSNLNSFYNLYILNGPSSSNAALFKSDFIDGYCSGPLSVDTGPLLVDNDTNQCNMSWLGDGPPNPFFSIQDFFNSSAAGGALSSFVTDLQKAASSTYVNYNAPSKTTDSYNRYTYYRMLAQLGTDSAPEPTPYPYTNKINLNYNNLQPVYDANDGRNIASATNFLPWTPIGFFTNAADRMLRMTFPNPIYETDSTGTRIAQYISLTNIPIYPTNYYTPALHRILQLAANIYDATTNKTAAFPYDIDYPSVFRPLFDHKNGVIYISGYAEVGPTAAVGTTPADNNFLTSPVSLSDIPSNAPNSLLSIFRSAASVNVYGIPWVIGAKKGFPNFNQFDLVSVSEVERQVQIVRSGANAQTNVQYNLPIISNAVAVQVWNSYTNSPYTNRTYTFYGYDSMSMSLSNESKVIASIPISLTNNNALNPLYWSTNKVVGSRQFYLPMQNSVVMVSNAVYHTVSSPTLTTNFPGANVIFEANGNTIRGIFPQLVLNTTNRLKYVMIDTASHRIIDYVQFDGMTFNRNLLVELAGTNNPLSDSLFGGCWDTNLNEVRGIRNQINLSEGNPAYSPNARPNDYWRSDSVANHSQPNSASQFGIFMGTPSTNYSWQAPFTPTGEGIYCVSYQANDPLVHYMLGDLTKMQVNGKNLTLASQFVRAPEQPLFASAVLLAADNPMSAVSNINSRYLPWGNTANPRTLSADPTNAFNMAVKDSMMYNSDQWQFPTGKFPNIGWLGRVHRGTPWQTVYLKPFPSDPLNWAAWSGNAVTNYFRNSGTSYTVNADGTSNSIVSPGYSGTNDSVITMPTNDWALLDLFTTAPNDNASRGQLSINQTNLAAWAAVLDGVITLTNSSTGISPWVINPDDVLPFNTTKTVQSLVDSINSARANGVQLSNNLVNITNTFPGGAFTSLGQILAVPQLTINSPYINTNLNINELTDAVIERIPQQILSLLRVGSPRYVIYAYGQSLKPANNSIVQSGPYFGMCNNYQITGEVATRTVLRIENFPVPSLKDVNGNTTAFRPHVVVESYNVLPPE